MQWIRVLLALVVLVALLALLLPLPVLADDLDDEARRVIDAFDIERAFLSEEQIFVPQKVTETEPLADALAAGKVEGDMRLVILERDEGRLAFLVSQIAYHHVAQGEMKGKPYLVSF